MFDGCLPITSASQTAGTGSVCWVAASENVDTEDRTNYNRPQSIFTEIGRLCSCDGGLRGNPGQTLPLCMLASHGWTMSLIEKRPEYQTPPSVAPFGPH